MPLPSICFPSIDSLPCILCSSMIIFQEDSVRDHEKMASHTAQEFQIWLKANDIIFYALSINLFTANHI